MQKLLELLNHRWTPYVAPLLVSLTISGGFLAVLFYRFVFMD